MLQIRKIIFVLCLLVASLAGAQDAGLPAGKGQIILFSGKIIKDAVLWKLHPTTIEYLKEENLHDVPIENISYIHYPHADYELNDSNKLVRIEYDKLVLLTPDTIFCFIKEINPRFYIYTTPGKTTCQSIERYNVRKHILAGVKEEEIKPVKKAVIKIDSTAKPQGTITEGVPVDYYTQGKADGNREFRGNGSLTGGMLLGFVPVVGWIAGPLTLAVPPRTAPTNLSLYKSNSRYRAGYERGAWRKKATRTVTGLLAGAAMFFALTLH